MKEFVKDFRLYSKIKKEEEQEEVEQIETRNWGDDFPPNMTDSWARELGII